ncbi:Rha family transcriptional regulator [Symbiopectobacterium sp. RP]|uniref:Rha family transcriptional regulator n=1 Tax=Symbiopectobacterium sp. RP TaxID=3248553 RepID=UPI003D26C249
MQNLVSEYILTMSSCEIAELTEKHHRHVLRDIESMLIELAEDPEGYAHFWTPHKTVNNTGNSYLTVTIPNVCLPAIALFTVCALSNAGMTSKNWQANQHCRKTTSQHWKGFVE